MCQGWLNIIAYCIAASSADSSTRCWQQHWVVTAILGGDSSTRWWQHYVPGIDRQQIGAWLDNCREGVQHAMFLTYRHDQHLRQSCWSLQVTDYSRGLSSNLAGLYKSQTIAGVLAVVLLVFTSIRRLVLIIARPSMNLLVSISISEGLAKVSKLPLSLLVDQWLVKVYTTDRHRKYKYIYTLLSFT